MHLNSCPERLTPSRRTLFDLASTRWLPTTPSESRPAGEPASPKAKEWEANGSALLVGTCDVGAFLGELYARVAGTHPLSKGGYAAHSQRPLTAKIDKQTHLVLSGHDKQLIGQVAANITSREIVVLGKVRGNMVATDRVDIRSEGALTGDVTAARISIEDGAFFKGGIDIRKPEAKPGAPAAGGAAEPAKVVQA